jgi:hypothetical protein
MASLFSEAATFARDDGRGVQEGKHGNIEGLKEEQSGKTGAHGEREEP